MPEDVRLVVAGTGTDIGKTVLAALLVLACDAVYWKPVQAGTEPETDRAALLRMTGLGAERTLPERYVLARPASPDQAAHAEGLRIEAEELALPDEPRLIVETAGGVMVPLSDSLMQADMLRRWALPVVLAAHSGLGTLNHTLLTLEALGSRSVHVCGIVMIGPEHRENRATLERWADVPVVGAIPHLHEITRHTLVATYRTHFTPIAEWNSRQHIV